MLPTRPTQRFTPGRGGMPIASIRNLKVFEVISWASVGRGIVNVKA